jgi:hypothetical protein
MQQRRSNVKILILHLSDIHFFEPPRPNYVLEKCEKIASAVRAYAPDAPSALLVMISGDVAFSGRKSEYEIAEQFFSRLLVNLGPVAPIVRILCVPGNHDHDFRDEQEVRRLVIDNLSLDSIDDSIVASATAPQEQYFVFEQKLTNSELGPWRLSQVCKIQVHDEIVGIRLINSAWISRKKETQGSLFFPASRIESKSVADCSVVVSVLHHPSNWFELVNGKEVRRALENHSDIIVTGHEHDADQSRREYRSGASVEYIEGGVLQDSGDRGNSSFNLIWVDTSEKVQAVHTFVWSRSDSLYEPIDREPVHRPFRRNAQRILGEFALRSDFESQLQFTIPIDHFSGRRPSLDDIFVYPDLVDQPLVGRGEKDKVLYVRDVVSYVQTNKRLMIAGPTQSGRTSLAYKLYGDLRALGYVPVLIGGGKVNKTSRDSIRELLRECYSQQYASRSTEAYVQLPAERRAVIIDDWHNCRFDISGRAVALDRLCELSSVVVVVSDYSDIDILQSLTGEPSRTYLTFRRARIEPLGFYKRGEMIEKWYQFGGRASASVAEDKIVRAERVITAAVDRGKVPSFPAYVLLFLRQLDVKSQSGADITSQGYLYQALVTTCLAGVATEKIDLDSLLNYLSELAYFMFRNNQDRIGPQALRWHYDYCELYAVSLDYQAVWGALLRSGIMVKVRNGSDLAFSYRAVKCFFVARYMSERISSPEMIGLLGDLCGSICDDEPTAILCSLSFLCKDTRVIDAILARSRSLFKDVMPCDIVRDTSSISGVISELPELISSSSAHAAENRRSMRTSHDLQDERDREVESTSKRDSSDPLFAVISSLRCIEVLGQLLRNFAGSMVATRKNEIAAECISVGFRLLSAVLDAIVRNSEEVARMVIEMVRAHRPYLNGPDLEARAKHVIFQIADNAGFGVIRHISDSLSFDKLRVTVDSVADRLEPRASAQLVRLAVHLDTSSRIPIEDVKRINETYRRDGAHYARSLMRNLLCHHLFLYSTPVGERQQVCALLSISVKNLPPPVDEG